MVIDYSKWDNLELSDDSDVEVHPNVDKKSFIRWKQRDIHEKRDVRSHEKDNLRSEQVMNDKLLGRIELLLKALKAHVPEEEEKPEEFVLQTLLETSDKSDNERAPGAPDSAPTYSQMLTRLGDKVSSEIPKETSKEARWGAFAAGLETHRKQLADASAAAKLKLETMEKEDSRKITSDGLHVGFDSTIISKATPEPPKPEPTPAKKSKKQVVEVLNPGVLHAGSPSGAISDSVSSGAEADVETVSSSDDEEEEDVQASKLGKQFAKIKSGDYRQSAEFISKNPTVLAEAETDGLLVEGFNAQMDGKENYARQCVHQALLLQYCRQLGRDGVALLFKRITTPGHQAQKVFNDDVNQTYARMRSRCKEILAERAANPQSEGVEQIQLHPVDPGTQITIGVPRPDPQDDDEKASRAIFESFPPGLRRALETGQLDEVNKVLGKMSVEEAEEIVSLLSEGGMLSLESQVIDATTEEGQAHFEELKKAEMEAKERGKGKAVVVDAPIQEEAEEEAKPRNVEDVVD